MENDIAFKVIVKNDGISDIILKTLMLKGEAGGSIASIEKTSSVGVVDTYTITLNDGNTSTFEVTNGSNIESIEKTATSGLIDTYTVTLTNGDTTTFEVKNGEDAQLYELPENCVVGYDVEPQLMHERVSGNYLALDNVNGIQKIKIDGFTHQKQIDGSFTWNQLARDMTEIASAYNLDKWYVSDGTANASGGIVTLIPTSQYGRINCFIPYIANHKLLVMGDIKLSNSTNANSVVLSVYGVDTSASGMAKCSETTEWQHLQAIYTYTSANPSANRIMVTDARTSDWGTIQAKNIVCIDLTEMFGSTKADEIYAMEQAEAGSGAAWFKYYFPDDYYPYNSGIQTSLPSPVFPEEIIGIGEKQLDGTYTVTVEVVDADDNSYYLTASGLSAPVYSWDTIDFKEGIVHRGWGYKVFDGTENWNAYASGSGYSLALNDMIPATRQAGFCNRFIRKSDVSSDDNIINFGLNDDNQIYMINVNISGVTDLASWKTYLANNETVILYPLNSAVDESVTISGDISIIEHMRDWIVEIKAPQYTSETEAYYYAEIDFPDGYEEIDFPLDDLLYYQDEEFIEFPQSWGFAIGYVFDASEIRFVINATKKLHDGFYVEANRSLNLALDSYMGAGGGGTITGFNFVDASFIREYGQIQIRLKTENPHGLPLGALLGARVNSGRLRITFHAPE